MPYLRRLDSGKWQATVRLPSGKRVTRTDSLKRVVADWAREEEARAARGEWRDPRAGRLRYEQWRDAFMAARVVEADTTGRRDTSVLANHLDPQWEGWRLPAITRIAVQGWIRRMDDTGVGPHAIRHAYNLLSAMLAAAADEGIIGQSPCRRIDLPATPEKLPEWFTYEQLEAITDHLPVRHAAAAWLMAWCGLRWGEAAGLKVGRVIFLRRRLQVWGVNTQLGKWKPYPKTSKSRREIPVEPAVLELLAPLCAGKSPDDLVFLTERPYKDECRPWSGANWRARWHAAIADAQAARPGLGVPDYAPHALRHTAASWLVQRGVPLYDVQRLLGHESPGITARYSHLAPDAHDTIEQAWARIRATHPGRTDLARRPGTGR